MDGVTDAAFRYITAKYGNPDITITEFTSVEGICAGAVKNLDAFLYDESERPIVAQVFGSTPEAFYKAAFVVAELGFDGIDINMGCPAKNVASRGSGAALIQTPELAKNIIKKTQRAAIDWSNGKTIEETGLPESIIEYVHKCRLQKFEKKRHRHILPVSMKTRIGYDSIVIEEWIKHLLEMQPVAITIHGRTLKQMYSGNADFEAIARAARLIHQTSTIVLGNGDVKDLADAQQKIDQYDLDGILIGRNTFGNPWIFRSKIATLEEKFSVAIEHAQVYEKIFSGKYFIPMRKHLSWYCRGFPNAVDMRQRLMKAENAVEVAGIIKKFQ